MSIKVLFIAIVVALTVTNSSTKCVKSSIIKHPRRYVSVATDKFFVDFYKILANHKRGNLIFSPISLNMILTMASLGAGGNTENQLKTSLRLPCNKSIAAKGYEQLSELLTKIKGVELTLVNNIFTPHTSKLKNDFRSIIRQYFKSDVSRIKLTEPERAAKAINEWYAIGTNNHITNLFKPSDIENAQILLANAVYFKGEWTNKFNPQSTNPYPFFINGRKQKNVPMMFLEAVFYWGYIPNLKSSFIELPYGSQKDHMIKMVIILPNLGIDIRDVERHIDRLRLGQFEGSTSKVALYLPKFKIQSEFDLKPILQNMEITEMFENRANFSGMIENAVLKVSKIIQKAVIEVNEEGSEAAAATGITMESRTRRPEFIVDRPFLCLIVRQRIKSILFAARVMDPTAG